LPLTHTKGFNPRPSVSIALPLSLGVSSCCELLDFDLEGEKIDNTLILEKLNESLVEGVRVLQVYDSGAKIGKIAYLDCNVSLEYDRELPADAVQQLELLFRGEELIVEKKGKNGITEQNIIPMIRRLDIRTEEKEIRLEGLVCCQNPTLNPMQLVAAIQKYLPELAPDFASCRRREVYDEKETVFR
jgi:radical SAM-linked protein